MNQRPKLSSPKRELDVRVWVCAGSRRHDFILAIAQCLRFQHVKMANTQSLGDLIDRYHCRIALSPLQIAEILLRQSRQLRELLLSVASRLADPGAIVADEFPHIHVRNHWRLGAGRFIYYSV